VLLTVDARCMDDSTFKGETPHANHTCAFRVETQVGPHDPPTVPFTPRARTCTDMHTAYMSPDSAHVATSPKELYYH
jgi:hypothetical protein